MLYYLKAGKEAASVKELGNYLAVDKNFKFKRGNELRHTPRAREEFLKGEAAALNKWKFIMSKKMPFLTNRIFGGENPFEKKKFERPTYTRRSPTERDEEIPKMTTEEDEKK